MSWLSEFWRNIRWDMVFKAIQRLLVTIVGTVGKSLAKVALEEVRRAEATGLSGIEKYEMAFKAIKDNPHFRHLPKYAINVAIESAIHLVDPKGEEAFDING